MNRTTIAAIVISTVVAGQGTAAAQDSEAIQRIRNQVAVGETISVLDASGGRVVGTYLGTTGSVVKLEGTQGISGNQIARVTKKDSTRNGTTIGALIGGGAGAVGALVVGAICANEGGACMGATLGLVGLGVGAGAGIGWLGDSLTQQEIYRADGTPRRFSSEARFRAAWINRSGGLPGVGLSWSTTSESGFGIEVNGDRTIGASDGLGKAVSYDGRVLYAFGRSRVQPYVSGGVGFNQHEVSYTYSVPPSPFLPDGATYTRRATLEAVAPVFGGGVRLQPAAHIVIRPEVSWFFESQPLSPDRKAVARAGVSIGATW